MAMKNAGYSRQSSRAVLDEFDELAGIGDEPNGSTAGDRDAYVVEHLATFTVTRETGIVYPADGMRRLLQLEKTNGIWSQKMQLCIDGQWVLIMDYESGSVMERFSASLIQEPTAFTSSDPVELYNNVLVFIVGGNDGRREMHIFQCHDVSAQDLVHDLNALKGGSSRMAMEAGPTAAGGMSGPPAHQGNTRDFAIERERERDTDIEGPPPRNAGGGRPQMSAQLAYRERGSDSQDEVSSTGSERLYEQDIAILNRCFDDIEKFIARLQHAAAASRELERRRRQRKSKSVRDAGEGMLALRTRPPPERDFVDVLQKFKLSFNLLARLRAHIHDPNAPELVHFLFTPLALIVDASNDACADGRLASRVVQPLLTADALNLLANCVTSKETELWHSLGDPWLIPREQWKTSIPPYQPVFMDGWSPDYQVDDQPLHSSSASRATPPPAPRRSEVTPPSYQHHHFNSSADETDYHTEHYAPYSRSAKATPTRQVASGGGGDSISGASTPEREIRHNERDDDVMGERWASGIAARGGRIVRVTYPRTANNDKELTVQRGEYLEIIDSTRKWWKARNRRGRSGHVPHTIVAPVDMDGYYNDGGATPSGNNMSGGNMSGSRGDLVDSANPVKSRKAAVPSAPPTPPPMPPPPQITVVPLSGGNTLKKNDLNRNMSDETMQDELRAVLTLYRERKNRLEFKKTPDLFIQQTSSPQEIVSWLEAKGFDELAQRKLRMPGHELFSLSKKQLEILIGPDEGKRLYSQILVQRNVSGYKTTSSSELQSILRKAREKVEIS